MPLMASAAISMVPVRDRGEFAQPAHAHQILFAAHGVDDAAGAEEEQRLEKRVRHQVEDAGGKGAHAGRHEHVAQLAYGGVGQDPLDVGLHQADRGGQERRQHAR